MSGEREYFIFVSNAAFEFMQGVPKATLPPKPTDPAALAIYKRALLDASQEIIASTPGSKHEDQNFSEYRHYFGQMHDTGGVFTTTYKIDENDNRIKGKDGKDLEWAPRLDQNEDGVLKDWILGGDDYKIHPAFSEDFTKAYAYATASARTYNALIAGKLPKEVDKKIDIIATETALKKRYPEYGTNTVEFDDYDGFPVKTINDAMGDNSKTHILPANFTEPGFTPPKAAAKAPAPKAPVATVTQPAAPQVSTPMITFSATESPTARAYNAAFGFDARDKGRGIIKGKFHANGVDVDLGNEDFRKKVRTVYTKYQVAFEVGTGFQRDALLTELADAYTAHAKDKTTGGAEYLIALGIFDEAASIDKFQHRKPVPNLITPRWDDWRQFREKSEFLYKEYKTESMAALTAALTAPAPKVAAPAPAPAPKAAAPAPKSVSAEAKYFELVHQQFLDWQNNKATALPKAPEDSEALLLFTRAKLGAAMTIAKTGDEYKAYFGKPSALHDGAIVTRNEKNEYKRYLDTNFMTGTLESHFIGGDKYTVPKSSLNRYTTAMKQASQVLAVLNGFDKEIRATDEGLKTIGSNERARLATMHTGGDIKKYNEAGFDHNYDDASTVRINQLSGDSGRHAKLPEGFKAPGLREKTAPAPKPKPSVTTPAPKPTTTPAASTADMTFTATESPSSRTYNATFGLDPRDKDKGFMSGTFRANGVDVDLGTNDFNKKVRAVYDKYHAAFDKDQNRYGILKELSKEYGAHAKDKTTGGAEYLVALGIFNDALRIDSLRHLSPPTLVTARWPNSESFSDIAEGLHNSLKAEYTTAPKPAVTTPAPKPAAPTTTTPTPAGEKTVFDTNESPFARAFNEVSGRGSRDQGKNLFKDMNPPFNSNAYANKVLAIVKETIGRFNEGTGAERKELYLELFSKVDAAHQEYADAIQVMLRGEQINAAQKQGKKELDRFPSYSAFEDSVSTAYQAIGAEAARRTKAVTAPEETPAPKAPAAKAPAAKAPAVEAPESQETPAPKPKPVPKPKLKAGGEVKAHEGDSLSKLALRSDELMAVALDLAKKGEIEGVAADTSKRGVAGWVAGVIAQANSISNADAIEVGQKVKLPTVAELKAMVVAKKDPVAKPVVKVETPVFLQPGADYVFSDKSTLLDMLKQSPLLRKAIDSILPTATDEQKAEYLGKVMADVNPGTSGKPGEKIKLPTVEQVNTYHAEELQEAAALEVKTRTVTVPKDQTALNVVHGGVLNGTPIKNLVTKIGEAGLNDKSAENLQRAAAILLAAANNLDSGASKTKDSTLVIPTDEQILAGVAELNKTVASADSKGGSLFKKHGEDITPGELKTPITKDLREKMKTQVPGQ